MDHSAGGRYIRECDGHAHHECKCEREEREKESRARMGPYWRMVLLSGKAQPKTFADAMSQVYDRITFDGKFKEAK